MPKLALWYITLKQAVTRYKLRRFLTALALFVNAFSTVCAQESATVDVPNVVKAGELLRFTISLNRAPNFDGGSVMFMISGPGVGIQTSAAVISGQTQTAVVIRIPESARGLRKGV
jgi:hypothetical protein